MFIKICIGFFGLVMLSFGCGNNISEGKKPTTNSLIQISGSDGQIAYIKFRSFQNLDSTWGFTIFVNSKPFIHQRRIPLNGTTSGFMSKADAEKVAGVFIKLIQNGDFNPELNRNMLDSLKIFMN